MTANEDIRDAALRHQVHVRRFATQQVNKMLDLLEKADRDVVKQIREGLAKILAAGGDPGDSRTIRRLKALLEEIRRERERVLRAIEQGVLPEMVDFGQIEAEFEVKILDKAIPIAIDLPKVTPRQVKAVVETQPFAGRALGDWWESLREADQQRVLEQIRIGHLEGQSIPQIVRRIAGTRAGRFKDGALSVTRRQAEAIVRTGVNGISNAVRNETWKQMGDAIEGLVWTATLDGRTCFVAGTMVETPNGPRPIEAIKRGDYVLGGSHQPRIVTFDQSKKCGDLVDVQLSNGERLACTSDHLFLTEKQCWIEAKHLKKGQKLAIEMRGESPQTIHPAERIKYAEGNLSLPHLWSIVHASKTSEVLFDSLLPNCPAQRRLQTSTAHVDTPPIVSSMWQDDRAVSDKGPARKALQQGVLFAGLLRSMAHRTATAVQILRRAYRAEPRSWREVLLLGLPSCCQEAEASKLSQLWDSFQPHQSHEAEYGDRSDCSRCRSALFASLLHRMAIEQRSAKSQDQQGVYGREAPAVEGRLSVQSVTRPGLAGYSTEGAEEVRSQVRRLWEIGRGLLERVWSVSRYRSRDSLLQFHLAEESERHEQSSSSLRILPPKGGGQTHERPDDVAVVEVLARQGQEWVYDLTVDVDHSFIVGGVVVHNSAICRARDGHIRPVSADQPLPEGITLPRLQPPLASPPAHPQCRSVLVGYLSSVGLLGERPFVRDKRNRRRREMDFRAQAKEKAGADWRGMSEKDRRRLIKKEREAWAAANIGRAPAAEDYQTWLSRQPAAFQDDVLGKTRGKLFRKGGIKLDQFVDFAGDELTLDELRGLHPDVLIRRGYDVIVLDEHLTIIGSYHAPVPLELSIFQATAYPPLRVVNADDAGINANEAVYHLVTFEKGRYEQDGDRFWALKIVDGEEHIDNVRAFLRKGTHGAASD